MSVSNMETWQEVLDVASEHLKISNSFVRFMQLESYEEKVDFCLRNAVIKLKLQQWLRGFISSKERKSSERASELRLAGNFHFSKKRYDRAIESYTQCVFSAPFPETTGAVARPEELSLGFANRSAAFFHSGMYREALHDVVNAFEVGYPSSLHYKLYLRKAQCQVRLGDTKEALDSYTNAKKCLSQSTLDSARMNEQLVKIELLETYCLDNAHLGTSADEEAYGHTPTALSGRSHEEVPPGTSAVDVCHSPEKGRFTVANKDLLPGAVLSVEKPYASVLLPSFARSHCHHCHKEILNAVPCSVCDKVRYCSFACSKTSWTAYHKWECGLLDLLYSIGVAHLALRMLLVTGLSNLVTYLVGVRRGDLGSRNHNYHVVFELVAHGEKVDAEDSLRYSLTSALLLLLLDHVSFFDDQETSGLGGNLKSVIGGALLRHILQLVCNAYTVTSYESRPGVEDGTTATSQQVSIATAIYPNASLTNHSCNPNVVSVFHDGATLAIRAIRMIRAGEEILICYGPHYRKMPFVERQKILQDQYCFRCTCDACSAGEDPESALRSLKCESCESPLRQPNKSGMAECVACGAIEDYLHRILCALRTHDLYAMAVKHAEEKNHIEAVQLLNKCLSHREKVLHKYNTKLLETRDMLVRCLRALGDYRSACRVLQTSLDVIREVYGEYSLEVGYELLKLSDVMVNAISQVQRESESREDTRDLVEKAEAVLNNAQEILLLHCGSTHSALRELRDKRDVLHAWKSPHS
ncbi:SET and MYND domain-containing protein 4-like [Ornithodoros turicata]|uniref:SET and MYND domain-containing protein 4-like n=1 Tax=Ornithodoros turicata TaxID=34597 RepID=UPI003139A217